MFSFSCTSSLNFLNLWTQCSLNHQPHVPYTLPKRSNCLKFSPREGEIEHETHHLCTRQTRPCWSGRTRPLSHCSSQDSFMQPTWLPLLCPLGALSLVTVLCGPGQDELWERVSFRVLLHGDTYGFSGFTMALVIQGFHWSGWDFTDKTISLKILLGFQ